MTAKADRDAALTTEALDWLRTREGAVVAKDSRFWGAYVLLTRQKRVRMVPVTKVSARIFLAPERKEKS